MSLLILALASFFMVFALGFNSRNVNNGDYALAFFTSTLIGISQTLVWHRVMDPSAGALEVLVYSLAGGLGIISAMAAHRRFVVKAKA